jgi:hypothetical protein
MARRCFTPTYPRFFSDIEQLAECGIAPATEVVDQLLGLSLGVTASLHSGLQYGAR